VALGSIYYSESILELDFIRLFLPHFMLDNSFANQEFEAGFFFFIMKKFANVP